GAEYPPRLYLCLRFPGSLAVAAQDSRPSGSLLLSRKARSSSTSCRFSPAHCNGDFATPNPSEVLELLGRCGRRVLDSDWPYWNTYENFKFVCAIVCVCPGSALVWPAEDLQLGCEPRRN